MFFYFYDLTNFATTKKNSDYKTNLSITDLEPNRIVDVKYGSQKQLYRAKVVQVNTENQTVLVHYLGWNNRYDEWIKLDKCIRMLNDENNVKRRKVRIAKQQQIKLSR